MRLAVALGVIILQIGCSSKAPSANEPSASEVAASVVSGALNNTGGSSLALNLPAPRQGAFVDRALRLLNPIGTASAATWTCSGGSLSPTFAGPSLNPYSYTPLSCSVTWGNDRTASSAWSSAFLLNYGSTCDSTHVFIENQSTGCTVTRTTGPGGNTRTITGPDGNSYAITHDTDGAGTGWDSAVTPAPTDDGVVLTETSLVISGSHLMGTVSIGGSTEKVWDHTVSTGLGGLAIGGTGTDRVVTGSVTVQHNLAKLTSTTTFNSVHYGAADCCFPTAGTMTTTFDDGANSGKTETLSLTPVCGEALLTTASGTTALTLQHCL